MHFHGRLETFALPGTLNQIAKPPSHTVTNLKLLETLMHATLKQCVIVCHL